MNETTPVTETPSSAKLKLTRKGLIIIGATIGMIIAGGIAVLRQPSEESETEVDPALVDEINSIEISTE